MELNVKTTNEENNNNYPFYHLLTQHPKLSEWMSLNYPFSISTDDSGVFHTSPSLECLRFMKAMNVCPYDMGQIMLQTIDQIFARNDDFIQDQKYYVQNDIDIDGDGDRVRDKDGQIIHVKQFLKINMMKRISELVKKSTE